MYRGASFPLTLTCRFLSSAKPSGTHGHPLQRSDLEDEHPRSSSDESVRPSGSLTPAVPTALPLQQYLDQIPASRKSDPNIAESCTYDHTEPRKGISSDWPDNYCYTRTPHTAGIYPSWYLLSTETHRRATTGNTRSREASGTAGRPRSLGQRPSDLAHTLVWSR
jgi:hypothetical protein